MTNGGRHGQTRPARRSPLVLHRKDVPRSGVPAALAATIKADPWARALGVEFLELRRGACRVALALEPHMLNFQGAPHGGVIFSLADIAFGAACNAHGDPAVALSMTVNYLAAVPAGARLVAEARVRKQGRRAGFYEVSVTGADGTLVAVVQCVAHRVSWEVEVGAPVSRPAARSRRGRS